MDVKINPVRSARAFVFPPLLSPLPLFRRREGGRRMISALERKVSREWEPTPLSMDMVQRFVGQVS